MTSTEHQLTGIGKMASDDGNSDVVDGQDENGPSRR